MQLSCNFISQRNFSGAIWSPYKKTFEFATDIHKLIILYSVISITEKNVLIWSKCVVIDKSSDMKNLVGSMSIYLYEAVLCRQ